ncbi:glycine receptor subunit beta-like isoform X2 [Myxocyprinus asiaticus]|uniref:glycine receptor subunit beta-like isoform X2 n=1 Tax=Myxocyprinus asiaticus TaxID=70543 RepID=UPI0022222DBA|nr:glycine receptor subunit beta-like isoform X2 [Myxocyprinus asiaticus]
MKLHRHSSMQSKRTLCTETAQSSTQEQVMLNSPRRIEAEKVKMAQKEKENKTLAKTNSANGTGGTPIHVSTLQVVENRCKNVCTSKSDLHSTYFSIVGSLPRDLELSNFDCYGKPKEVTNAAGKSQNKNNNNL